MENLASVSKSIQSKRNQKLDSVNFPFSLLTLAEYDIRKNRTRNSKLKDDLERDGQLQPITVTKNGDIYIVVNGRTRYLEMEDLNQTSGLFNTVKVELYEELTELEQNYLNAQINISQTQLTSDEKIEFVIKYKDVLNQEDLMKALGLSKEMVDKYIAVAKTSKAVRLAFTPKNDGYGRSETKVEELGKVYQKIEQMGVEPTEELLIAIGKKSEDSEKTRDEKRKYINKFTEKAAQLVKNPKLAEKYTVEELVDFAEKESSVNGSSGDTLPKNSSEKYKIVDGLLKETYDFAVLLFAEGLYRIDENGNTVESETKRVIDRVDDVIVIGNEIEKLSDIEDYGKSLGKKIRIYNEDVIKACDGKVKNLILEDDRRGFVYVNGASLFSQRPEFMNFLKKKYPNSTIAIVVIDYLFGKSQVTQEDRSKEIVTVYAGAKNFDEVIEEWKNRVKYLKIRKYAELPQEKYILFV